MIQAAAIYPRNPTPNPENQSGSNELEPSLVPGQAVLELVGLLSGPETWGVPPHGQRVVHLQRGRTLIWAGPTAHPVFFEDTSLQRPGP